MPGLVDLIALLDSAGLPRGLITRNVKSSVEYFHSNAFGHTSPFEPAISRECAFPYKPSPAALLHVCEQWGIPPSECIMVGDSAKVRLALMRCGCFVALVDESGWSLRVPLVCRRNN
jgi:HAD superfamily hydrolase (TIGR01549 family)